MLTRRSGSGAAFGFVSIMFALAFIVLPFIFSSVVTGFSRVILVGFGVLLLLVGGIVIIVTRLYRKTSANEAFVRTGMGGPKAIMGGGCLVIPVVHQEVPVSLETMRLDVSRTGADAMITLDNLRVDIEAEFYIKVKKDEAAILAAATSLGEKSIDSESVKKLVENKLVSALRTVSATKNLQDLHRKRDEFAEAVQEIVSKDLEHNGLSLESVTISKLDQTSLHEMKADSNVFDAQGAKSIAVIVQQQKIERNKIEREADMEVEKQNVEKDKYVYNKEVERETAEAEKEANIKKAKSLASQEAASYGAEQEQTAEMAVIKKNQTIEVAGVEKQQAIDVASQEKEKVSLKAKISKERELELATREKEISVANKEKERATADTAKAQEEAKAEKARQDVLTVAVVELANRNKEQAVIGKQAEVEKTKIEKQMNADVQAYTTVKEAEGRKLAADNDSVAVKTKADAQKEAKIKEAEGEKAVALVPVNVERERVVVRAADVEVTGTELKYKAEFADISKELEIALAQIAADKEVRIESAKALGAALSNSKMTIWSDQTALERISGMFNQGQAYGKLVEGLTTEPGTRALLGVGSSVIAGIAKKLGVSENQLKDLAASFLGKTDAADTKAETEEAAAHKE